MSDPVSSDGPVSRSAGALLPLPLNGMAELAARIAGSARIRAGEIVMAERVYCGVAAAYPDASRSEISLKGKSEPTVVYRLERALIPVPA